MCGEAENLSVYRVGKSLTSIWVFLYPKVDFIKNFLYNIYIRKIYAGIAQLVEQLTCNEQVGGSNPSTGSNGENSFWEPTYELPFLTLPLPIERI